MFTASLTFIPVGITVVSGSCNELYIASQMSPFTDIFTGMFAFCTIILSGDETISHQSEQQHPQLQHPPRQGEADGRYR